MIDFIAYASNSKGNLYTLSNGQTKLLIDPGLPLPKIKKALGFGLSKIDYCLLSHEHKDHSRGASEIMAAGIDLYAGRPTIEALDLSGHRVHNIILNVPLRLGTWTTRPLPVPHDVPNLAFLLVSGSQKCLFMIDALYCPYRFRGLTHIFLGVNFDNDILRNNIQRGRLNPALGRRIIQTHMSLSTALDFFKAQDLSKVEVIHVLHCSESNLDKDKTKEEIQRATGKLVIIAGE